MKRLFGKLARALPGALLLLSSPAFAPCLHGQTESRDRTRGAGKGLNFFSEKDELAIGQRYSNELNRRLALIDDGAVSPYVVAVGNRLIAASRKPQLGARFFVVNTKEVNAFALPGGFVYVNRGLVDLAEDEGQLAGVMAHEIAHVVGRHGTKQMSKQLLLATLVGGASALAGAKSEKWGSIIGTAGGVGMLFATMKYSRDDEHQADALAAETLSAAGYPPQSLIGFFERMDPSRGKVGRLERTLALVNTHPPTSDRIRNLRAQIAGMSAPANRGGEGESFAQCKRTLAAMAPPPARDVSLSQALAAVGMAEGGGPGRPQELPPLGSRDQAQRALDLPGKTVWLKTGVLMHKGEHAEVWAEGEIQIRKDIEEGCDPNGVFGTGKGFFKPIPQVNTGALVGRISAEGAAGKPFPIGDHAVVAASETGELELGINDDNNFDNRGGFRVWILTRR